MTTEQADDFIGESIPLPDPTEVQDDWDRAYHERELLRRAIRDHYDILPADINSRAWRRWMKHLNKLCAPYGYWTYRLDYLGELLSLYGDVAGAENEAAAA